MTPEQRDALKRLITGQRLLALSVLAEGEPAIGLLPYAIAPDFSALLVHASRLARHTRGLAEGAPFDALIHVPEGPDTDPLQVTRVTLRGSVAILTPESQEYQADERRYLERFPSAAGIMGLGDFRLFRLRPEAGRLVTGFAGALNLSREAFIELGGASRPH